MSETDLLSCMSEEDRDRMIYSKSLFAKIFKDKFDDSKTVVASVVVLLNESEDKVVQGSLADNNTKEESDGLAKFMEVETVNEPALVLDLSSCRICEACGKDNDLDGEFIILPAVICFVDCGKKLCAECQRYRELWKTHNVQNFEDMRNISAAFAQWKIKDKTSKIGMSCSLLEFCQCWENI